MGIYIDVDLAVEAKNKEKVVELFKNNNLEFYESSSSPNFEGEDLAFFSLSNRDYADIKAETALLIEHKIQYSAYNYGEYGEVDEEMRHYRITGGTDQFTTIDVDESKINYTDLQTLINTSKSLAELQSLVDHHRHQEKFLPWH